MSSFSDETVSKNCKGVPKSAAFLGAGCSGARGHPPLDQELGAPPAAGLEPLLEEAQQARLDEQAVRSLTSGSTSTKPTDWSASSPNTGDSATRRSATIRRLNESEKQPDMKRKRSPISRRVMRCWAPPRSSACARCSARGGRTLLVLGAIGQ